MIEQNNDSIVIFYSWQSDSPIETNQKAIRVALRDASNKIEEDLENINLILDEATRDTVGGINIPSTIFDKVLISDIFVCDLTTINSESIDAKRKVPNPNVLIELGYAIATIGWDRILMLFNKAHGNFPLDLPFDIAQHRIIAYKILDKSDNNGKGQLKSDLFGAIKAIIQKNPIKQSKKKDLNPDEKKREIDINNLRWILNTIHIPTMDTFIEELPERVIHIIFHFWEGFKGVLNNSLFHLYNKESENLIKSIYTHWDKILSYGNRYRSLLNSEIYSFIRPEGDMPFDNEAQNDWDNLLKERELLNDSFKKLLNHVRENYIEISLEETSKNAINEYIEFSKKFLDRLS